MGTQKGKYHVTDDGKVYSISDSGEVTELGDVSQLSKRGTSRPKTKAATPAPASAPDYRSTNEKIGDWLAADYNWLYLILLLGTIGYAWFCLCSYRSEQIPSVDGYHYYDYDGDYIIRFHAALIASASIVIPWIFKYRWGLPLFFMTVWCICIAVMVFNTREWDAWSAYVIPMYIGVLIFSLLAFFQRKKYKTDGNTAEEIPYN